METKQEIEAKLQANEIIIGIYKDILPERCKLILAENIILMLKLKSLT